MQDFGLTRAENRLVIRTLGPLSRDNRSVQPQGDLETAGSGRSARPPVTVSNWPTFHTMRTAASPELTGKVERLCSLEHAWRLAAAPGSSDGTWSSGCLISGDEVHGVDCVAPYTGGIDPAEGWPIFEPRDYWNFHFHKEDCRTWFQRVKDTDFDYAFHLAAMVGGRR